MTEEQIKAGLDNIVGAAMDTLTEDTAQIEVFLVIDSEGQCEVDTDEDTALERYTENIGGSYKQHVIKLTLTVPLPKLIEVAAAALPRKDDGNYELVIKS